MWTNCARRRTASSRTPHGTTRTPPTCRRPWTRSTSRIAKTLNDAKDALSKQPTAAQEKVKGTAGKVKDDRTRKDLKALIGKAATTKSGKDAKAMDAQAKQLKELMGKVDASVKAKQDADRKSAEEKARKEAGAQAATQAQANAQAQQQYTAPQQSYTPTYTAPAQPAQPATPSKPSTGGSTGSVPISGGHGMTGPCDAACQAEAMKPIQR